MDCVQVWLDGRELYKFPCSGTTTVTTDIPVNPPQRGRVVSITRETSQTSYKDLAPFLNFCEIQVGFAPSDGGAVIVRISAVVKAKTIIAIQIMARVQKTRSFVESIQVMMSSCDCKEALSGAGPVAGIAVGCAIVFFILGVLSGIKLRLSRSRQPSATHGSPVKTFVTCDLGTSSTMTHPTEPHGTTSEDTADHSNNVYDELKARNDDNKSAYTSLRFQKKDKKSEAPSDYVNTRKILMNE
ncbi:hypothetical protein C0Q70_15154 [Pomacea canaliculata]|uniref:Uncharacterized protein n=1 Tax=Pomacea canaliculata TaxID=400727 RepID=A0A2T7NU11_POMCA|nr:hypothetical protein C0Q70_15154 [Pomacea canaliculata]